MFFTIGDTTFMYLKNNDQDVLNQFDSLSVLWEDKDGVWNYKKILEWVGPLDGKTLEEDEQRLLENK